MQVAKKPRGVRRLRGRVLATCNRMQHGATVAGSAHTPVTVQGDVKVLTMLRTCEGGGGCVHLDRRRRWWPGAGRAIIQGRPRGWLGWRPAAHRALRGGFWQISGIHASDVCRDGAVCIGMTLPRRARHESVSNVVPAKTALLRLHRLVPACMTALGLPSQYSRCKSHKGLARCCTGRRVTDAFRNNSHCCSLLRRTMV